ncbi:MAG: IPT/TIG domain-containing protein, partial [Acidimicrobiales bacterium]|nr:IPT/TIG domain-containing protein [Acidimicrobiales bacterium]
MSASRARPTRQLAILVRVPPLLVAVVTLVSAGTVLGAVTVAGSPSAAASTPTVRIAGGVAALPSGAAVLGPTDPGQPVTADLVLRPRDPAALEAFVTAVSTPGSASYRHYLTTAAFRQAFGPTDRSVAAARAWLAGAGLTVGPTSSNGFLIPVSGTAGSVGQAFAVPLVRTRLRDGRIARAATADPSLPASLAPSVMGVIGLSNVAEARPLAATHAPTASAPDPTAVPSGSAELAAHAGPAPCAAASQAASMFQGWTADSVASAYGLSSLYANGRVGAAQTIGIFELASYSPNDVATYQACFGTNASVTNIPVDGGSGGGSVLEPDLDIEVAAGLAPSSSISVFSGPNNGGSGPIDTYTRMVDDPSVRVLTTSWGLCELEMDPATQQAEQVLFQQAAAQGQTMLAASGDAGSSDCFDPRTGANRTIIAVDDPADQPDVTGVGGTSLSSFGPDAPVESVWNSNEGATGGGNSVVFAAPSWQQIPAAQNPFTTFACPPPHGTTQCREVPDVAATADPGHGDIVFVGGAWLAAGGTSAASPLWAALVADLGQGCAASAGFLNSQLYPAGASGSPPFHDVVAGGTNNIGGLPTTDYPTTTGYDLTTGWGSPDAPALLGLLSRSPAGCPAVTGLSPSSGPAVGGTSVVITGSGFGSGTPTVQFGSLSAPVVAH